LPPRSGSDFIPKVWEIGDGGKLNSSVGDLFMGFSRLKDESTLLLYDNIRLQIEAERGLQYKFIASETVKQRATALREEITRRRLQHTPIKWPRGK
jgi:hypothetical protein